MQVRPAAHTLVEPLHTTHQTSTLARTDRPELTLAKEQRNAAFADLLAGLVRWPLWFTIGWLEIRQRYRRSLFGPFWITLSVGIFVTGIGIVYSALFRAKLVDYLPYLAVGIMIWTFISTMLLEGCSTFIAAEGAIKQNPVPISVHVYRVVWRNIIILAHNLLIYVILIALFPIKVNLALLLFPVGLALAIVSGVGMILFLGVLSTRFRDISLIITNLIQVAFFITPIFWKPETLPPDRRWVATFNPLYHLIEILRAPLLGEVPPLLSYLVAVGLAVLTLTSGVLLYVRFSRRIAYWL